MPSGMLTNSSLPSGSKKKTREPDVVTIINSKNNGTGNELAERDKLKINNLNPEKITRHFQQS